MSSSAIIHTQYTPAHEVLYRNFFLATLPKGTRVEAEAVSQSGAGDLYSPEWHFCVTNKIRILLRAIAANPGELFMWSDVDVQFFDFRVEVLQKEMEERKLDCLFLREGIVLPSGHRDANTGFFICRSSDVTRRFFEQVLQRMESVERPNDQTFINGLLDEGFPLQWDLLANRYYCRSLGFPPPRGLALHHATMTNSVSDKIRQLQLVRMAETGGITGRAWATGIMGMRKIKRIFAMRTAPLQEVTEPLSPIRKLRKQLGTITGKISPEALEFVRSLIRYRCFRKKHGGFQAHIARQLYSKEAHIRVLAGPFAGMKYFNRTGWGALTSRWVGTYEMELRDWVHAIVERRYDRIIDLGCAEGYYAVGFARSLPATQVYAFDIDYFSRRSCGLLAKLNESEKRVTIGGLCTPVLLNGLIAKNTLVFCDVEGNELDLLDPAKCPALVQADILVEVHQNGQHPALEVEALLRERFHPTHEIAKREAVSRQVANFDASIVRALPGDQLLETADEERHDGRIWLKMEARPISQGVG
ncbi:MAG: hypothetical protein JWL59_4029 [Chthoniobacteraceae bacterium]|nr:hypothetical protein [Chthoniobacteraceae bacterium]